MIANAEAIFVAELTSISLFFGKFKADIDKCKALDPLVTATEYFTPIYFAKFFSNLGIDFPNVPEISPLSKALIKALLSILLFQVQIPESFFNFYNDLIKFLS